MKRYLAILLLAAASALAEDLKKEDLVGLRVSLVDENRVETYSFGQNGVATAQIGTKKGPVAGPAFRWKVEAGRLLITDGDKVAQSFELVERSKKSLKLRRESGEVVVFSIDENK